MKQILLLCVHIKYHVILLSWFIRFRFLKEKQKHVWKPSEVCVEILGKKWIHISH